MTSPDLKTILKTLLDSFVREEKERNFQLVFSTTRSCYRRGSYCIRDKKIFLYAREPQGLPKTLFGQLNLLATAFHELSHHLDWSRNGQIYVGRLRQGKRLTAHGSGFKKILDELLDAFNRRYKERLKGVMIYDRRNPRRTPKFVPSEVSSKYQM